LSGKAEACCIIDTPAAGAADAACMVLAVPRAKAAHRAPVAMVVFIIRAVVEICCRKDSAISPYFPV
jgi:hypothetical protein